MSIHAALNNCNKQLIYNIDSVPLLMYEIQSLIRRNNCFLKVSDMNMKSRRFLIYITKLNIPKKILIKKKKTNKVLRPSPFLLRSLRQTDLNASRFLISEFRLEGKLFGKFLWHEEVPATSRLPRQHVCRRS